MSDSNVVLYVSIIAFAVGLFGLPFLYSRCRMYWLIREVARRFVETHEGLYSGRHTIRPAEKLDFHGVNQCYYSRMRSQLGEYGFQFLGDIEDVTFNKFLPEGPTFIRLMVHVERNILAAFYTHMVGKVEMREGKPICITTHREILELESILSDATFILTSHGDDSQALTRIAGIHRTVLPLNTSPEWMLEHHDRIVTEIARERNAAQRVLIDTLDEAIEAIHLSQDRKVAHYQSINWLSEADLVRIAKNKPPWYVKRMMREILRFRKKEHSKNKEADSSSKNP